MRSPTRLVAIVAAVLTSLGPASSGDPEGKRLADAAVELMISALELGVPEHLPAEIRDHEPEHVESDYAERRFVGPGEGFFEPALLKPLDARLYRAVRRFWRNQPTDLLAAVPHLGAMCLEAAGDVRVMLFRLVVRISDETFDAPGHDPVMERVFLQILERSQEADELKRSLELLASPGFRVSADGYGKLLAIARRWSGEDCTFRVEMVRALASSSKVKNPPTEVCEYLLEVAVSDGCADCRAAAITTDQIRRLGRERTIPAYLGILDGASCEAPKLAEAVIKTVSIWGAYRESVPHLIGALGSCDVLVRACAVVGLVHVVGKDGPTVAPEERVFAIDYEHGSVDSAAAVRLSAAVSRWRVWWRLNGAGFVGDRGEE